MKTFHKEFTIITKKEIDLINITPMVKDYIEGCKVESGMVFIMSHHTTSGITVNEGLPDIEQDIINMLKELVRDDKEYRHARFLPSDGQMAINAPSHLRSCLLGFEVFFPIMEGMIRSGSRQTIYFAELDGPQERIFSVHVFASELQK
jgi:secondary thiamine-phosphate synthase enzyme